METEARNLLKWLADNNHRLTCMVSEPSISVYNLIGNMRTPSAHARITWMANEYDAQSQYNAGAKVDFPMPITDDQVGRLAAWLEDREYIRPTWRIELPRSAFLVSIATVYEVTHSGREWARAGEVSVGTAIVSSVASQRAISFTDV